MNAAGRLVLLVLAILIAIGLLAITIVYSVVPKNTSVGPTQPIQNTNYSIPSGLNQCYTNAADGAFELKQNKPFVVNSRRDELTVSSFLFSDMPFAQSPQQMSTGFSFYVLKEQVVVALQCVDQYFATGERQVGIFEVGRRLQLVGAPVSKTTDALVQGLRTHALLYQEQVHLYPGILYACLGQIASGDYRSLETGSTALFTNAISFLGTCSVVAPVLTLPNSFPPSTFEISPFPGFQLRSATPLAFVPTFRVDTQSASMPLNYIANLNMEVFSDGVRVLPGACASQGGVYNIQLFAPITKITTSMNLNPNSWYAVYVINKNEPASVILSSNFPEPKLTQSELAQISFRRIGFVRTQADPTKLVAAVQTGPETRRTMTFAPSSQLAQSFDLEDNKSFTLPLPMVAPTTNICTMQVELFFDNALESTPAIMLTIGNFTTIGFRRNQSYQIQQTVLQLSETFIPRAAFVTCNFEAPFSASVPRAVFTVLDYTEDV